MYDPAYDRFGSLAVIKADISLMTAFGGKADVQSGQFCENLGDIPECPLRVVSGHYDQF